MGDVSAAAAGATADGGIDVTVLLCTRNRCEALGRSLTQLLRLEIPPAVRWEVVIVDNGSTDGTAALLADHRSSLPLRVVREPRQGLSRARTAGLAAARGTLVCLTDDDCLTDQRWLWVAGAEFARDPELDILGGRVELYDLRDRPTTTRTSRERAPVADPYAVSLIVGCNMAMRRRVVESVGWFDIALGGGTSARAGEDVDYVYRGLLAGLKMVYSPDLLVLHNHGRRTDAQARHLTRAYSVARGALFGKYLLAPGRGGGMRVRAYADFAYHARLAARDVRSWRLPRRTTLHYWYLGQGMLYWLGHRVRSALVDRVSDPGRTTGATNI